MNKKYYGVIYVITNKLNNKQYVGLTTRKYPINRFKSHIEDAKAGARPRLHSAIRKYGEDSFVFQVVWYALDQESLDEAEDYFIESFGTMVPNGYNLKRGGSSGKFSEELPSGWFCGRIYSRAKKNLHAQI